MTAFEPQRFVNEGRLCLAQSVLPTLAQSQGCEASFYPHKPTRKKASRRIVINDTPGFALLELLVQCVEQLAYRCLIMASQLIDAQLQAGGVKRE
jgi:hypothetical protein